MPTLKPQSYASLIEFGVKANDGLSLAENVDLRHAHRRYLYQSLPEGDNMLEYGNPTYVSTYGRKLSSPWSEIATGHTQAIVALNDTRPDPVTGRPRPNGDVETAYAKQHDVVNAFYRWLMASSAPNGWTLPVLYAVCRDLRRLAAMADEELAAQGLKATKLEEASRLLQKCFSACLNDRGADTKTSRKMGTYYMATLLFKTYFQLHSTALCKNLIKGIGAADLTPFRLFPLAHQVAYEYYMGVFAFLREDYAEAERMFLSSLTLCHAKANRNIELILDYLIPVLLLRGVLPSKKLLRKSTRLAVLYGPFIEAFKTGNVELYDQQLLKGEKRLMQRGTYLVVERAREGAMRALMKKAWILEGKPARLSIDKFQHYISRGTGVEIDNEEVECLLANMIYKNLIKGYISHSHQIVVLSKGCPFPWYPPFADKGEEARAERSTRENAERMKAPTLEALAGVNAMEIA